MVTFSYKNDIPLRPELMISLLQTVTVGIIVVDVEGKVMFANKRFEDLLGYSAEEITGLSHVKLVYMLVGKESYEEIRENLQRTHQGETIVKKRKFLHKTGQVVPLEVQSYPFYDGDEEPMGTLLILRDIHEDLMVEITNLVNSTLSLKEVLKNTVKAVVDNMGLESTAVFLLNDEKKELDLICCNAYKTEEDLAAVKWKIGEGPPGKIVHGRAPVYIRNLRTCEDLPEHCRQFHSDKSSVGFPLICKEEILGAIAFDADSVRSFSEREMESFQKVANQVALAIYNAKLFSRLEHLSNTDGLTGLFNHRRFHELLRELVSRSDTEKDSIGILMLDVDYFKSFNDSFGHMLGDQLLRELAEVIVKNVRSCDVVARYGGEEFAVILPNCNKEIAVGIAQRIRAAVEESDFCIETNAIGKITISVGVAVCLEGQKSQDLLVRADMAMYIAKKLGRNRVEVYERDVS